MTGETAVPGGSFNPDSLPRIREILNRDREWSLYALGDLALAEVMHCEWRFSAVNPSALTLFYRAFDPPVFFAIGAAMALERLLDQAPLPPRLYLHIRPEILDLVCARYHRVTTKMMQRMILRSAALAEFAGTEIISANELNELVELYNCRDGKEKEGTFFLPAQVEEGIYFGARCNGRLVAAAGTHLINRREGVAAIGNVFCLPAYRGKGLGGRVTSAVVNALVREGIQTIGLNVSPESPATRLYHRLGFREACRYVEGTAAGRARS
ncbi:MAG: GNAT family N-acetyltransferase [Verrucomicrobia bacterium]|nr:GNAT family N-acetyltransferase [Verrucomicrobiota bacterium]